MKEKIGNVVLDYTYYPGKDLYSDGEVEEELLEISEKYQENQWNRVIAEKKSWPVMYHYSHIRQNIVEWLPIGKKDTVLEIGAGCGAITGVLAKKAESVTCIELSKRRSLINANRNKKYDNIEILVGNFQDISQNLNEKFDYITLIGVFEYSAGYIGGEQPYVDMLKTVSRFLKPDGKLIIAIENRLGLKYWAGCREDHVGDFFEGIEGYPRTEYVKTFSLKEWQDIFSKVNQYEYKMYYPYPDYKFPMSIHSDCWLPKVGELREIHYNFDRDRIRLFDETRTIDQLIENDLYPLYANSYLLVAALKGAKEEKKTCIFSKYSNDRSENFAVRTDIYLENGRKKVIKTAETAKGIEHLENILRYSKKLEKLYKNTPIRVNHCRKVEEGIELEYLEGTTLEQVLDQMLKEKRYEEAWETLKKYIDVLKKAEPKLKFQYTEEFEKVFGSVSLPEDMECLPCTNIDPVCANILWSDSVWEMLDYEWTFEFPVPLNFQIYRVLKYYLYTSTARSVLQRQDFWEKMGITREEVVVYEKMEENFQRYIDGKNVPLRSLYSLISPGVYWNIKDTGDYEEYRRNNQMRVYTDQGNDFSEKTAWTIKQKEEINLPEKTIRIRIDPCEERCIVGNILLKTESGEKLKFFTNGRQIGENLYFFDTTDPYIVSENIQNAPCKIFQSMTIQKLGKSSENYVGEMIREKAEHDVQIVEMNAEKERQEEISKNLTNEVEQLKKELEQTRKILGTAQETLKTTQQMLTETQETLKTREHLIHEMESTKVWKLYSAIKRN